MTPTKTKNDTNSLRVRRGGSWYNDAASWVRPASRLTNAPVGRSDNIGFRTSLPGRQPR